MYLGQIVETAPARQLYPQTRDPYPAALLSASPIADPDRADQRKPVLLTGRRAVLLCVAACDTPWTAPRSRLAQSRENIMRRLDS